MQQPNNSGNHHRGDFQAIPFPDNQQQQQQSPSQDDFLDQILSSLPSPWGNVDLQTNGHKSPWDQPSSSPLVDDPLLLASRLRHHQISPPSSSSKPMVLQLNQQHQQLMVPSMARSGEPTLVPLSLANDPRDDALASNLNSGGGSDGLYNGLTTPPAIQRAGSGSGSQQQFPHPKGSGPLPSQNYGAQPTGPTASASCGAGGGGIAPAGGTGPPRQRVRARRGQATDPHSIAERLRRERIAERMKALQELVPNANKTDKASMLDEIIDYVKFLQLQVKVLSMSRLGGAAAVAPLVGDMSSEGGSGGPRTSVGVSHPSAAAGSGSDSLSMTEHQVAKLMEDDMGSAMQYLQGKGLCLMPISLASAISSATGHARAPPPPPLAAALHHHMKVAKQQLLHGGGGGNNSNNIDGASPPSMSVLTVQSANVTSDAEASIVVKTDAGASVSKA